MEVSVTLATINKANAAKYVSITDAKTKIEAEVADGAEYTKLKAIVTGVTETISVANVEVINEDDAYQTVDELITAIRSFNKIAIVSGGNVPADQVAAITSAETEIKKLKEATATALSSMTITAMANTDSATTYAKAAGDTPKTATLTNLKVTVKEGSDANAKTTDIVIQTITFEVQAATTD